MTEDEVKRMKEGEDLLYQLIPIQYIKPPEVVTRTADIVAMFGYNKEAMQLRGWYGSQTTQQLSQCNS